MDTYRVITREPGPMPDLGRYVSTTTHYVKADSFTGACIEANVVAGHNAVVMEVALSRPLIQPSEAELASAIDEWLTGNGWVAEDIDDVGDYMSDAFVENVRNVAQALDESGLIPGLAISEIADGEGYTMVELYGYDGTYRSRGAELKNLTDDREAVGMSALLNIAQALIHYANLIR